MSAAEPTMLVRYDAMCSAIAECHRVDEVKDIRDKARALEVYARQAKNTDAERKAADIRLRAERRTGELLGELARSESRGGGDRRSEMARDQISPVATNDQSPYAQALAETGLSRQTAHRYQQLAAVPKDTFEQALADPVAHPSASRIVREARDPVTPVVQQLDRDALRVWGNARDFERQRDDACDVRDLFDGMTETMQADMRRLVPRLINFWTRFAEENHL